MTENGDQVNLLKLAQKNSWNRIKWAYFWRVLAIWNYSAARARSAWTKSGSRVLVVDSWSVLLSLLRAAFTKFTTIFQNSQVLFYLLFLTCSPLLCVNIYLVFVDSDSFIVLFLDNIKKFQRYVLIFQDVLNDNFLTISTV